MITTEQKNNLIALTAEIVSAHVSHNSVATSDLSKLISNVHASLSGLGTAAEPTTEPQLPAVSIRASIKPDYIVCLEDGKHLKVLKRHLMTEHQLTPATYRAKWQLPADYPLVASAYASERRTLALSFGLGRGRKVDANVVVEEPIGATPAAQTALPRNAAEISTKGNKAKAQNLGRQGLA